jgi:hypothetical protein
MSEALRQTTVMDTKGREAMRKVLREYAEHVVEGWDRFTKGDRNRRAGHDANEMLVVIGGLTYENKSQELVTAQFLGTSTATSATCSRRIRFHGSCGSRRSLAASSR